MPPSNRPRSVWAFPLFVLALALIVLGSDWGTLATALRGLLFDEYQHVGPRAYTDTRAQAGYAVRVLDADAASLARFGPWPWSHAVLARLTNELKAQGAQLIVFAMALDKPDPASAGNLIAAIPPGPSFDGMRVALAHMPSPDTALAQAFSRVAVVTGFSLGGTSGNPLIARKTIAFVGSPLSRTPNFETAMGPIAPLTEVSAGVGALNLVVDRDGTLRRVPLVFRLRGAAVASLEAEVLRVVQRKRVLALHGGESGNIFSNATVVTSVEAFGRDLPTTPNGSLWIAYAQGAHARDISAAALDRNTLAPGLLKNAIVYVGSPDDLVATPQGMRTTASVHAEAMENILLGSVLRRPAAAGNAELACLVLLGVATILLLLRFGIWWAGLFAAAAIAAAIAVSWHLYIANHVLLDALGPGLGVALVFMAGAGARVLEVARARASLHEAFANSLSASSIERIARRPSLLKLDGENRTVSYLVCGVRGFAALAQSFRDDPVSFTRLLQRVFAPLMDEALAHRGTIERITSEGFSCFWNAPLDDPEHAIHACEAASGMMEVIARINDIITHERRIDGMALAPVEIGIGVATGPAIAGGFRTHGRMTYSAVGECAVLASRIQALSGDYGPAVIVSEDTRKSAERGFAFLEVDYVAMGGEAPVKLYAMLGNPVMRASPKFRALTTFHDHIFQSLRTQQWDKTRDLIEQCRRLSGASQKLYDLHLARIAWYQTHPPGPDWDGAFRPILK